MSLSTGTRLGTYEITGTLGAGGMGEVYRATDTKLGREVAIKTLPAALAEDKERLARFEREAKLLASLNHAHIAAVYGLDEQDGTLYIAMELVDGESLEKKLARGPLPIEYALTLGLQIAEALDAAHVRGVVHRDLKPANVMVTPDDVVKVLDFGLAKAFAGDPSEASSAHSPALSLAMTQQGLVLGTAGYMSPEQASGQATDQRADIWAFGVVLYEMLTGQPLFGGESVPHILAAVLRMDPDWDRLPQPLHPGVKRLLERCLERSARNRYHSIADVRIELEKIAQDPKGRTETSSAASPAQRGFLGRVMPAVVGGIAVGLAGGLWAFLVWPRATLEPINRFAHSLPERDVLRNTGRRAIAISPDGRAFVYNTINGLMLRRLGERDAQLIRGTEPVLTSPTFSPDGQTLVYWDLTDRQLKRIALSGGTPALVANAPDYPYGISWGRDGSILFGQSDGIWRVSENGGTAQLVIPNDEGQQVYGPSLLPDGDHVLFAMSSTSDWNSGRIYTQSLSSGDRTLIYEGGNDPRYYPTGHLVFALDETLFAIAFDLDRLETSGLPVPVLEGVARSFGTTGVAQYSVSDEGTLVYFGGTIDIGRRLAWIDRQGRAESIDMPARDFVYAQLSPDGTRVALDARDEENDIWIFDLERKNLQRLTLDPGINRIPIWYPDGRLAFSRGLESGEEEIWLQAADGSGEPEQLTAGSAGLMMANDFSPDGSSLLIMAQAQPRDILMVSLADAPAAGEVLIGGPADQYGANISPDGRYVAYQSDESGQWEIWVRPFPDVNSGRTLVSTNGGTHPLWSRSGDELFYLDLDGAATGRGALMRVPVDTSDGFVPGVPEQLFANNFFVPQQMWSVYDISLDDQRFLMFQTSSEGANEGQREVIIVQNWLDELERQLPVD